MPLLIVGRHGRGRTAALATDVAPHWVGGLVDRGQQRVVQDVPGGFTIDVGDCYARFFRNLLVWRRTTVGCVKRTEMRLEAVNTPSDPVIVPPPPTPCLMTRG